MQECDPPRPAQGHVIVRVEAAGINFLDVMQRRGACPGMPEPPIPAGVEGAGIVAELGEGVADLKPGDRVA